MLFILAPSKTMDMSPVDLRGNDPTVPVFQKEASYITEAIRATKNLAALMKVSPPLAERTRQMYQKWGEARKPAMYSYVGDVYKGFYAATLTAEDTKWAQEHMRIMSGLYGILKPLDLISPYRLEMKAVLKLGNKKDVYEFWGSKLAEVVDAETDDGIVCVLSSDEYARPVTRFTKSKIITPTFYDNKANGKIGTVPIYSKMMRGVMARWVIDNRVKKPEELKLFKAQGYYYDHSRSTPDRPGFYRENPAPIQW